MTPARKLNPFDPVNFCTGNFWQEKMEPSLLVDSIHQSELEQIQKNLDLVKQLHQTRTIIISGLKGSGKSYLLQRLQSQFNQNAFFVYISPWNNPTQIWRHTLRHTVDSLMQTSKGASQPQILAWLKGMELNGQDLSPEVSARDKGLFILNLRTNFPTNIYYPKDFFSILYALHYPELFLLACDWLKGENLDQEDLNLLGVNFTIQTEQEAQNILVNLGRVSCNNLPVVLCFDQLDQLVLNSDHSLGLQPLFSLNAQLHHENVKNFLIIISLLTETWREQKKQILPMDLDRVESEIELKEINLEQAGNIWAKYLAPWHLQLNSLPNSAIAPFSYQDLLENFPQQKTNPRAVLRLGQSLWQQHDSEINNLSDSSEILALFQQRWHRELLRISDQVDFESLSGEQLLPLLLNGLKVLTVTPSLAPFLAFDHYQANCVLYQGKVGLVWIEEPNLTNFYHLMQACQQALHNKLCQHLYLIRRAPVGNYQNQGYRLYQKIMANALNQHLIPEADSIYILLTYDYLENQAKAGQLTLGEFQVSVAELEDLVRQAQVLNHCPLIRALISLSLPSGEDYNPLQSCIINLVKIQEIMGLIRLEEHISSEFRDLDSSDIESAILELCNQGNIELLNPSMPREAQLIKIGSGIK